MRLAQELGSEGGGREKGGGRWEEEEEVGQPQPCPTPSGGHRCLLLILSPHSTTTYLSCLHKRFEVPYYPKWSRRHLGVTRKGLGKGIPVGSVGVLCDPTMALGA